MRPTRLARRTARILPAVALTVLSALALPAVSQEAEVSSGDKPLQERGARGSVLFRIHCASCHGEDASGVGPMTDLLKVEPADLTRLSHDNADEFPAQRVHRAIDGRDEIRGHGSREMPVWGLSFQDLSRDHDQEVEVQAKIRALVTYLESIQVQE